MPPHTGHRDGGDAQPEKSVRLIEVRGELQRGRGAVRAPDAVVVAGQDPERIAARRDVGVVGHPPRAGLDPVPIEPLQAITEAHAFRRQVAQGGVLELQRALPRRDVHRSFRLKRLAVGDHTLDKDRRRATVERDVIRIDDGRATQRGEPESAVVRSQRAGRVAVALAAPHSVGFAEGEGRDLRDLAVREVVELREAHA